MARELGGWRCAHRPFSAVLNSRKQGKRGGSIPRTRPSSWQISTHPQTHGCKKNRKKKTNDNIQRTLSAGISTMQRTLFLSMVLAFVAAASAFAPAALPALRSPALRGLCCPPSPANTSAPHTASAAGERGRRRGMSLCERACGCSNTRTRAQLAV